MSDIDQSIAEIEQRLSALEDKKRHLEARLYALRTEAQQKRQESVARNVPVFLDPILPDRIKLFLSLFRGRPDVFPKRWDNTKTGRSGYSPACKNEWTRGLCDKPRVPCSACTHQAWLPVTDDVIRKHLCGDISGWQTRDHTIGIYPMLKDETCWFVAVDFDKENWQRDVTSVARKLGSALLTETMEQCPVSALSPMIVCFLTRTPMEGLCHIRINGNSCNQSGI